MKQPHKSQAAAIGRAGELPDGEQLRECIASGQVSAAQVVAHAGEVTTGWPEGMLQDDSRQLSKALSRDPNARAHAREAVTAIQQFNDLMGSEKESPVTRLRVFCSLAMPEQAWLDVEPFFDALYADAAAQQEEVARLREALEAVMGYPEIRSYLGRQICEKADAAITTQGAKE